MKRRNLDATWTQLGRNLDATWTELGRGRRRGSRTRIKPGLSWPRRHLRHAPIVRERGIEPPRPCGRSGLNAARLPLRHSRMMWYWRVDSNHRPYAYRATALAANLERRVRSPACDPIAERESSGGRDRTCDGRINSALCCRFTTPKWSPSPVPARARPRYKCGLFAGTTGLGAGAVLHRHPRQRARRESNPRASGLQSEAFPFGHLLEEERTIRKSCREARSG